MEGKLWLRKDDDRWTQQLRWNIAREILFQSWNNWKVAYDTANLCPLIEEAQWFLKTVTEESPHNRSHEDPRVFFTSGKTPRHQAYLGILTRNLELIKDAALNGDAAAQFRLASMFKDEETIMVWLTKSMHGGYSESFRVAASKFLSDGGYVKYREILWQGILVSAHTSISAYATTDETKERTSLYLTGQLWILLHLRVGLSFIKYVNLWYNKSPNDRDLTSGFIIGQYFNRLSSFEIDKLNLASRDERLYTALQVAHQMYLVMCKRSKEAAIAWILCSSNKRLPIVKDIRKLIAKMIWASRDESDWML
jgi:hypothetical protein